MTGRIGMIRKNFYLIGMFGLWASSHAIADQQRVTEIEVGALQLNNFELASFQRGNATDGWRKTSPTVRAEFWSKNSDDWNYGIVVQPLYLTVTNKLKDKVEYKNAVLNSGDDAKLTYQFHNIRFSANYPVYQNDLSYLRVGGSIILRYFNTELATSSARFSSVNILALPLPHIEAKYSLSSAYSLNLRADGLPRVGGGSLYDALFSIRKEDKDGGFDIGLRLFGGSYDPNEQGNFRNKIAFRGLVLRKLF
jgi:hypothetical protein